MQMDARKRWMYDVDRRTSEYMVPLKKILDVAEANRVNNIMHCPCVNCRNMKGYSKRSSLHADLVRHGFMPSYYCWTRHGERGVMMVDQNGKKGMVGHSRKLGNSKFQTISSLSLKVMGTQISKNSKKGLKFTRVFSYFITFLLLVLNFRCPLI